MFVPSVILLAEIVQAPPTVTVAINRILLPAFLITALVSYLRRREDIGGWLMYFYFWICAALTVYLSDAIGNYPVFLPSSKLDTAHHVALISAVYPRLIAVLGVVGVGVAALKWREWEWIERLKLTLAVTVLTAGISVALDAVYFHRSLFANVIRWIMLCVWLSYFHLSKRVHHVFRTKDWDTCGPYH